MDFKITLVRLTKFVDLLTLTIHYMKTTISCCEELDYNFQNGESMRLISFVNKLFELLSTPADTYLGCR